MESERFPEMLVDSYLTTGSHMPEGDTNRTYRYENRESNLSSYYLFETSLRRRHTELQLRHNLNRQHYETEFLCFQPHLLYDASHTSPLF
jgi:hypothetical protein